MTQLYIYILFHILFHYGLSKDIDSSLCCTAGLCCLSILHIKSLHLLTPTSQSTPHTPSLGNRQSVLCVCDPVSASQIGSFVSYFRFHIQNHVVFVFLFLTSFRMILSSCIHVAANDIISLASDQIRSDQSLSRVRLFATP